MKVSIVTTHLLGTGHLSRALSLADGFASKGHGVQVITGGPPVPHLSAGATDLVQLPPVRSDGLKFTSLIDEAGQTVTEDYLARRRERLCETLLSTHPDVLITELYPFGRRVLRREFDAALEVTRTLPRRPLILSSIRDILAPPSSQARARWTEERLLSAYDGVLVHADPRLVRLEDSWPVTHEVAALLHYTGFVAPPPPTRSDSAVGQGEILVSAGGGPVGQALFEAAIEAARLNPAGPDGPAMRLLVGGRPDRRSGLVERARGLSNVIVEAPRPDYRNILPNARLSISQAGYNTLLDIVSAGVRAIIAPFAEGGETEQTDRANAYASRLGFTVIPEAGLSPGRLAQAIEATLAQPAPEPVEIALDGTHRSVDIVRTLLQAAARRR